MKNFEIPNFQVGFWVWLWPVTSGSNLLGLSLLTFFGFTFKVFVKILRVLVRFWVVMGRTPFYRTSIELEHHFLNIKQTGTCSSIGHQTRTPYFWLKTNEHRTLNELEHHFLNIKQTRTCSPIGDQTWTPIFGFQRTNNEHQT